MQLVANNTGQSATDWQPSIKQRRVLNAAAEAGVNRSVTAIAKQAGVRRQTIYEWLNKDAGFRKAWDELPQNMFRTHLPGVVAAQVHKAMSGDTAAAKLVMKAAGMLGNDTVAGDTTNVTSMHLQVIQRASTWEEYEAITKSVRDQMKIIDATEKDDWPRSNGKTTD